MLSTLWKKIVTKYSIQRDPIGYARSIGVQIGENCRLLAVTPDTFGSEPFLIKLGNHVSVTGGVKFITHDGGVWVFRDKEPDIELFAPIVVKDNVFIGLNCMILPGVTIGENSIIGAGAIVTKDVPSGSVVVGVPGRVLCTIDEYYKKMKPDSFRIRDQRQSEKRQILMAHFGIERSEV
jgi:acetyltransferase-like isoleucine patch superfamily enzyme